VLIHYINKALVMKSINISVVIPLYNKESTVFDSIQTVLSQKHQPHEIIIIDDGSTDNSLEEALKVKSSLVKIYSQKNAGVSSARNFGISKASCEYIAFLDSDDKWSENFLLVICGLINKYPDADVFATRFKQIYTNGKVKKSISFFDENVKDGLVFNYFERVSQGAKLINSSSLVVTKVAIESVNGFPEGINSGEDILTWARLACKYRIALSSDECVEVEVPMNVNDRSLRTHKFDDEVGRYLQKLLGHVECENKVYFQKYLSHWYEMRTIIFLQERHRVVAAKYWFKMLKYAPFRLRVWQMLVFLLLPVLFFEAVLKLRRR